MKMTKIKWSRDMESRCLALLGGGAAKKVAKAAMAAMGKKPEKPGKPRKYVNSPKPTETEEHVETATAVEPKPFAIVIEPEPSVTAVKHEPAAKVVKPKPAAIAVEPEPAATAAPKAEAIKAEILDYPAIFNFDAPEYWDDFRVALNMASLET